MFLFLIFSSNLCLDAKEEQKGANEQAYEHASDNAIFNRVGDWFATVGKSKEEKESILAERKAKRATQKAEKKAYNKTLKAVVKNAKKNK